VVIVSALLRGRFPAGLIGIPVVLIVVAIRLFQRR
jgi:hypothetical protein